MGSRRIWGDATFQPLRHVFRDGFSDSVTKHLAAFNQDQDWFDSSVEFPTIVLRVFSKADWDQNNIVIIEEVNRSGGGGGGKGGKKGQRRLR